MTSIVRIQFDNPNKVFFSGQNIRGVVQIRIHKEYKVTGVSVKFRGYSRVSFEDNEGSNQSIENYYDEQFLLFGDGETISTIIPGEHSFNFQYILPPHSPSSYESRFGHVRHSCKAKLKLLALSDIKITVPYSVVSIYDLNTDPRALTPIMDSTTKTLCCWFCSSGPITLCLNLQKSGYVSGELIYINAECYNKSDRIISSSVARIVQKMTYRARNKHKIIERIVREAVRNEIPPGGSSLWSNVPMLIPPLPPSFFGGSSTVDVDYFFVFKVYPTGANEDVQLKIPIVIGTVPLRQVFQDFTASSSNLSAVAGPAYGSSNAVDQFPAIRQYPDLPPPSYLESECLNEGRFDGEDSDDSDDEFGSWKPRYVSYNVGGDMSSDLPTDGPLHM